MRPDCCCCYHHHYDYDYDYHYDYHQHYSGAPCMRPSRERYLAYISPTSPVYLPTSPVYLPCISAPCMRPSRERMYTVTSAATIRSAEPGAWRVYVDAQIRTYDAIGVTFFDEAHELYPDDA